MTFLSRDNDKIFSNPVARRRAIRSDKKIIVRVNRLTSNQRYYTMGFTF
jgi:hypothetical protein